MSLLIGIILAIILVVLLVLSKRTKSTPEQRRPTVMSQAESTTTSRFHAVSIQSAAGACEAAKSMKGKRFLSKAAPHIPLSECDALDCKCRFVHHADRRSGVDRRGQVPQNTLASTGGYAGRERRFRERRVSDEPRDFFA